MLYDLGTYDIPSGKREALITNILGSYDSSWGYGWHGSGIDYSAMIVEALAPYYKQTDGYNGISAETCATITNYIDAELNYYKSVQQADGTFDNNANSTAVVARALIALGIDPCSEDYTKSASGKNALTGLYIFKTDENTLGWKTQSYNAYASSDGLTTVAAYIKYKKTNTATSIYKFSTGKGQVEVYNNWPNKNILTGIIVEPSKTRWCTISSKYRHCSY